MSAIGLCFLNSRPALLEALEEIAPVTKSQLKKLGLKKNDWERPVAAKEELLLSENILNYLKINPVCSCEEVKVLSENESFLVLSKPHNCHSHPLKYSDQNNVLSWIRANRKDALLRVNAGNYDRGLLYRLDFETSGLLLYCKKDFLYKDLRENFSTLVEEKTYYAIVKGNFSSRSLSHKLVYGGAKNGKARALDFSHGEGITASLEATKIKHNEKEDVSLVKVTLKEGHRHQIRAQLSAEGHPILGDELYGGGKSERLFLHCYSYCVKGSLYEDPNMKLFSFFFNLDG